MVANAPSTDRSSFPQKNPSPGNFRCHRLQFYGADEQLFFSNVSDYLFEGLERGEGVLVIATPEHQMAFERKLVARGADLAQAIENGQLVFADAQDLLSRLLVNGKFEWTRFERVAGGVIDQVRPRKEGFPRRAYGEMVGLLWSAGNFAGADRLEEFWNKLLGAGHFQLFCAYPIDIFGAEFHSPAVETVLRSHSHLNSSGEKGQVQAAVNRATGEIFKSSSGISQIGPVRADVPEGEAQILWVRENHPERADEILTLARRHYGSEKRFRALVENSSDAIALTDPRGRILYASPSTTRVLGYKPEEIIGSDVVDLIHPADRANACRTMDSVLATPRTPIQFHVRVRCPDDSWCWIEATGSNLLEEPDISAIVFNYRDITARKTAETALQESEAALRSANAGLEQFAYAAAHDLQEPVRNVAIYTELLARKYRDKLDAEAQEFIKIAVEGALRMQTLTRDLLAFTRSVDNPVPAGAKPVADTNSAMAEVVSNLRATIAESEASVTWETLPDLPIHHAHLVQLLQNLVGNALKYRGAEPPRVQLSVSRGKDEWLVAVADNGPGIPAEYREHIFGLFKRLHGREIPGNGIGLAICSRIVTHYQGQIRVEPGPRGGSIFSFTLPRD